MTRTQPSGPVTPRLGVSSGFAMPAACKEAAALGLSILADVLAGAQDGITVVDADRRFVYANPAACEMLGYPVQLGPRGRPSSSGSHSVAITRAQADGRRLMPGHPGPNRTRAYVITPRSNASHDPLKDRSPSRCASGSPSAHSLGKQTRHHWSAAHDQIGSLEFQAPQDGGRRMATGRGRHRRAQRARAMPMNAIAGADRAVRRSGAVA